MDLIDRKEFLVDMFPNEKEKQRQHDELAALKFETRQSQKQKSADKPALAAPQGMTEYRAKAQGATPYPEVYTFRANYPGRGAVEVCTYSEGDIDDIIAGFRGFLISLGYAQDTITTRMGAEW